MTENDRNNSKPCFGRMGAVDEAYGRARGVPIPMGARPEWLASP